MTKITAKKGKGMVTLSMNKEAEERLSKSHKVLATLYHKTITTLKRILEQCKIKEKKLSEAPKIIKLFNLRCSNCNSSNSRINTYRK